jgi:hypothetical protein
VQSAIFQETQRPHSKTLRAFTVGQELVMHTNLFNLLFFMVYLSPAVIPFTYSSIFPARSEHGERVQGITPSPEQPRRPAGSPPLKR